MIIKVCGIRDGRNHDELSELGIDMIGINFYKPSSRYIGDATLKIKKGQSRVGVFVNTSPGDIMIARDIHHLDYAQLHGDEDVSLCLKIQSHIPIIKVFRITEDFDWTGLREFEFSNLFLFDTMTKKFGGSGIKFNWKRLDDYKLKVPFLLSGGIGPDDWENIKSIKHKMLAGIDINSKFEISPALKDVSLVREFLKELRK